MAEPLTGLDENEVGRAVEEAVERTGNSHGSALLFDKNRRRELGASLIQELGYLGYKVERAPR